MVNDSSNPMYLHPFGHPYMALVLKSFEGIGFDTWKQAINITLSANNKLIYVNGEYVRPIVVYEILL